MFGPKEFPFHPGQKELRLGSQLFLVVELGHIGDVLQAVVDGEASGDVHLRVLQDKRTRTQECEYCFNSLGVYLGQSEISTVKET